MTVYPSGIIGKRQNNSHWRLLKWHLCLMTDVFDYLWFDHPTSTSPVPTINQRIDQLQSMTSLPFIWNMINITCFGRLHFLSRGIKTGDIRERHAYLPELQFHTSVWGSWEFQWKYSQILMFPGKIKWNIIQYTAFFQMADNNNLEYLCHAPISHWYFVLLFAVTFNKICSIDMFPTDIAFLPK